MSMPMLFAALLACSSLRLGLASTPLEVLQSSSELSQLVDYLQSNNNVALEPNVGGTLFAPTNDAFDAFVDSWRQSGVNITGFSDIPQETQTQILDYHFTFVTWTPQGLCGQKIFQDLSTSDQLIYDYKDAYTPVGPPNTVGSFQATAAMKEEWLPHRDSNTCLEYDVECQQYQLFEFSEVTFTIEDDYTHTQANFTANNPLSSENFYAYPINAVLVPNVAWTTLMGMALSADMPLPLPRPNDVE